MNINRLLQSLDKYAQIGGLENGGVHRLTLTDEDKRARDLLKEEMLEVGLEVKVDAIGNMLKIIKKGSHNSYLLNNAYLF